MRFYLDENYKCHKNDVGNCRVFESRYFDGKADAVIEGYMFVPGGEEAILNGETVIGRLFTHWKPWHELDAAQRAYEREQLEAVKRENEELLSDLAAMVDAVYESDLERIEA